MHEVFNRLDTWMSLVGIGFVCYLWARRRWRAWLGAPAETVKYSQVVMPSPPRPIIPDERTDEADEPSVSEGIALLECARLDKTRARWIDLMLYSGYATADIRALLKGENATIGVEVAAARQRLGIDAPERTMRVKDERGERVIPI